LCKKKRSRSFVPKLINPPTAQHHQQQQQQQHRRREIVVSFVTQAIAEK